MTRSFENQALPEYKTPFAHGARYADEHVVRQVNFYVCSKDNSMDRNKWFFAVVVNETKQNEATTTSTHFFIREFDAWLFRASKLESKDVLVTEYKTIMDGRLGIVDVGEIKPVNFPDAQLWDGYTLEEVNNLI